jgi:lipopolysaccharide transport system permease protein
LIEPAARTVCLAGLWEYRELLYFLVLRDLKVRYKQTILGGLWAVIQPTVAMVVFSVFFGHFARMPSDGTPYPLFAYCGLLSWTLFAFVVAGCSNSLVASRSVITNVYFPRLIVLLVPLAVGLVDFGIANILLLVMFFLYGVVPGVAVVAALGFIVLALLAALGAGLWLSALNVRYRDVGHTIPFLMQLWFFATPVVYPSSLLPERWRSLYGLNPMAGVVEGFRWAMLSGMPPPAGLLGASVITTAALLVSGLWYFSRMEQDIADVL